jgi:hypothetical protein
LLPFLSKGGDRKDSKGTVAIRGGVDQSKSFFFSSFAGKKGGW